MHRLTFDAPSHTYRVGERMIPSVTQVLKAVENFDFVAPAVLERAREFGSHVHQAVDLFNRGELDEEALDAGLAPYLAGWKLFLSHSGFVVTHTEERVYNERLKYAGTLDARGTWKGTTWLIDLKSGAVPRSVGAQCAAYQHALAEPPKKRLCVQLLPHNFKLIACNDPTDFSLFTSCLNIWTHLHAHRTTRPARAVAEIS